MLTSALRRLGHIAGRAMDAMRALFSAGGATTSWDQFRARLAETANAMPEAPTLEQLIALRRGVLEGTDHPSL